MTGLRRWSGLRHPLPLDFAGEQGNGGDLRVYGYHTPDRYAYPPVGEIKKHAYELLNRSETLQLVENLKKTEPELVADVIPNVISYANLEKILRSLLREGIPIRIWRPFWRRWWRPVPRPMIST